MDIFTNNDTLVTCEDCGQPARRREIVIAHDRHARHVPFETHAMSLDDEGHSAVFSRVKAFYSRMFDLVDELQSLPPDDCRLTYGRLTGLDLGAVMPSACAVRTEIIPLAIVKVAGLTRELKLGVRPLADSIARNLLDDLRNAAQPIAAQLNAQYEARDF